jgi:hypothetical protein
MSGQGRQAKILSEAQIRAALAVVAESRYPLAGLAPEFTSAIFRAGCYCCSRMTVRAK